MRSKDIQKLIDNVESRYGPITLYGSEPDAENSTCFTVVGVNATFSIVTDELPSGQYDIQIEGIPPGDYVYPAVVSLEEFLTLMARVSGPYEQWP